MIEKVYHISFPVSDLGRTAAFYENVLGLKKVGEWSTYVEFDVGGVQLGFKLSGESEIFLLVHDVDKAYHDLRGKGVKLISESKARVRSEVVLIPSERDF